MNPIESLYDELRENIDYVVESDADQAVLKAKRVLVSSRKLQLHETSDYLKKIELEAKAFLRSHSAIPNDVGHVDLFGFFGVDLQR